MLPTTPWVVTNNYPIYYTGKCRDLMKTSPHLHRFKQLKIERKHNKFNSTP